MDARVRYTKKVVKEVFLDLLKERELDKITVTEICNQAQINRATFYKYYSNPSDLLNKLEEERLEELHQRVLNIGEGPSYEVFRTVLEELKENSSFYQTILGANGDVEFRNRVFLDCSDWGMNSIKRAHPELSEQKRLWLFAFLAEGFNGVLQIWQQNGMDADVDTIIEFIRPVIQGIVHEVEIR